jgi:hypothetical protein
MLNLTAHPGEPFDNWTRDNEALTVPEPPSRQARA